MNDPANFAPVENLETLPGWFQLLAMVINAGFGAAVARSRNVPVFGTVLAGLLVGFGGGIFRDMMLGLEPVAISIWYYLPAGILGAIIGALFFSKIVAMDTVGLIINGAVLGLLVTIGAQKALDYDAPYVSAIFLGIITASFGGLLADAMSGYRATIAKQAHWVGMALVFGTTLFVVISAGFKQWMPATAAFWIATVVAVIVTSFLRARSQKRNWNSVRWPGESLDPA